MVSSEQSVYWVSLISSGILDYISVSTGQRATDEARADTVEQFYFVTRTALKKLKNEKLAVKTEMKLAKLFVDRQTWKKLVPVGCMHRYLWAQVELLVDFAIIEGWMQDH